MTEFKMRELMRVTSNRSNRQLTTSNQAVLERAKRIINLLAERGPMRSSEIAEVVGYRNAGSANMMLKSLVTSGRIVRTVNFYHLRGQSLADIKGSERQPSQKRRVNLDDKLFEGDSLAANLRRYLRDHQDEPLTVTQIGRAVGYSSLPAAGTVINRLILAGLLRRYNAPEDPFMAGMRYQFVKPEHSGVKVTYQDTPAEPEQEQEVSQEQEAEEMPEQEEAQEQQEEAQEQEAVESAPVTDELMGTEPIHQDEPSLLDDANLIDRHAREFYYQTASRDVRELIIWLKERHFAKEGE